MTTKRRLTTSSQQGDSFYLNVVANLSQEELDKIKEQNNQRRLETFGPVAVEWFERESDILCAYIIMMINYQAARMPREASKLRYPTQGREGQ